MMYHVTFPPLPIGCGGTGEVHRLLVGRRADELVAAMATYDGMSSDDPDINKVRQGVIDRVMDMYYQLGEVLNSEYDDGEIFESYVRMRQRNGLVSEGVE